MSEGGAESAGEENSDTKADFFERRGGEKKIHLQTFWQPVSASHSHFLSFFFFFASFWHFYPPPLHTKPLPELSELPPFLSGGPRAAITPVITITISAPVSAQPSRRQTAKTEQRENEVKSLFCCLGATVPK